MHNRRSFLWDRLIAITVPNTFARALGHWDKMSIAFVTPGFNIEAQV